MNKKANNGSFKVNLGFLFGYLKPYKIFIIFAIFFSILGALGSIFAPKLLGEITKECQNYLSSGIDLNKIGIIGITLICIYSISAIGNYIASFILTGVSQKTAKKLREGITDKINKVPLAYFDSRSYGDLLSRVTNDVDTISQNLNQSISSLFSSITLLIGVFVMMFSISWQMTLIAIVSIPLSFGALLIVVSKSQKYFVSQQKNLGQLNGHIEEAYSGHIIVKTYNQEDDMYKEFEKNNLNLRTSAWKSQFISGIMMPIMMFIGNLSYIAIAIIGGLLVCSGNAGIEFIQMFIQYTRLANQPLQQIGQIANVLQSCVAAAGRVKEFIDEKEMEDETSKNVLEKSQIKGDVEFKDVNFGYTEEKQIIFDFNCKVLKGQKVAIVGPTGAGKTTIVNLLMRFYDVNSGQIKIDGVDTKSLKRDNVANLFGMVLQDTWTFEGTIRDNLRLGNMEASDDDVYQALKACHMDHYVRSLPHGLDEVLSENTNVSSGQKQLLTIARAMVANAPMLILDEATSSVDTRTEVLIQKAMDKLMENRTSFVIAHRLSTIKNADLILVLKDGNIIEQGNHEALLAQNGFYANLYNSQFSE